MVKGLGLEVVVLSAGYLQSQPILGTYHPLKYHEPPSTPARAPHCGGNSDPAPKCPHGSAKVVGSTRTSSVGVCVYGIHMILLPGTIKRP